MDRLTTYMPSTQVKEGLQQQPNTLIYQFQFFLDFSNMTAHGSQFTEIQNHNTKTQC